MKKNDILLILGLTAFGGLIMRSLTTTGIDLIKRFEGFRDRIYLDEANKPTIGYGHLIKPDEKFNQPMQEHFALELLRLDAQQAEFAVNELVTVPLTQSQFAALVSFVFNVGVSAFQNSTLLRKLNAGDLNGAGNEFPRWKYVTRNGQRVISNGLLKRRNAEKEIFLS